MVLRRKTSIFETFLLLGTIYYGYVSTKQVLASDAFEELVASNRTFDVIILEDYFNEATIGLSTVFSAPVVLFRTHVSPTLNQNNQVKIGFSTPMSFVPSIQSPFSDHMSFFQRFQNVLLFSIEKFGRIFHMWSQELLYNTFFKESKPTLGDLVKNISFVLLNTHGSIFYPQPALPNFQEIGGLHVSPVINPLPDDVRRFIDQSHQVIYFSFGGNVDFSDFSEDKQETILKVFQKVNLRVLLKTRKKITKKYSNILIKEWFPQNDILANPKVKVFITHGGLLSYHEAVFHAVPMIGIPIYGDHVQNVASAVHKGVAVHLDYGDITEDSLMGAIREVVDNEQYKRNVISVSRRYHDRQVSPMENAIYWIEYVAKYQGADHLKNAGIDMNFIQYHCLDVFLSMLLMFLGIYWLAVRCLRNRFLRKAKVD